MQKVTTEELMYFPDITARFLVSTATEDYYGTH